MRRSEKTEPGMAMSLRVCHVDGLWLQGATLVTPKMSGTKLQTRVISALVLGGFGGFVTLSGGLVWALWMSLASYMVRLGSGMEGAGFCGKK